MRHTLFCVVLLLAAHPVSAQLRPAIDLSFEFQPTNAVAGMNTKEVQKTVATNLCADLYKAIPFWLAKPADPGSAAPRLEVIALKDGFTRDAPWLIRTRLMIRGAQAGVMLSETLFKPGDYQLVKPNATNWSSYVQYAFHEQILSRHPDELKSLLARLPLGSGLVLNDRPPLPETCIVLPLEWETYKAFSRSQFRIDCNSQAGAVILYCIGVQKRFDFTPQQPKFPGLVAMLTERQYGDQKRPISTNDLAEISSLSPGSLFITSIEETSDLDIVEGGIH